VGKGPSHLLHGRCLYRPSERDSLTPPAHEGTGCAELEASAPRGVGGGPGGDGVYVLRCVEYLEFGKRCDLCRTIYSIKKSL